MLALSSSPVYKPRAKSYVTPKKTSREMAWYLRTLHGELATALIPLTVKVAVRGRWITAISVVF